ncbi:MAG: Mur ligase family protein [Bacteroidales bacterium]|nr:Mur ligase family protein [Bacteroidales bacterium]
MRETKDSLITSQTDLFLQLYRKQIIGVTGTKGKSTTASLIYHIVRQQQSNALLTGNIGIAPLDTHTDIDDKTIIIQEMSAHQLEHIHVAPHIAVFLNLFEEHLDHFTTREHYYAAKRNILMRQNNNDIAILNAEESLNGALEAHIKYPAEVARFALSPAHGLTACIENGSIVMNDEEGSLSFPVDELGIAGAHNHLNAMAAMIAARRAGISRDTYPAGA